MTDNQFVLWRERKNENCIKLGASLRASQIPLPAKIKMAICKQIVVLFIITLVIALSIDAKKLSNNYKGHVVDKKHKKAWKQPASYMRPNVMHKNYKARNNEGATKSWIKS